ncbi:60S ribosomal protein L38, partial [Intoshia linei]
CVIKRNPKNTKFKLRTSRHLLTLILKEADKVSKLKQALPPTLKVEDAHKKRK